MQDFSPLFAAFSSGRMETYRLNPADSDKTVVSRYLWNVALCESLYPSLQFVEVTLRNAIHEEMSGKFKSRLWFEDPAIVGPSALSTALQTRQKLSAEALLEARQRNLVLPPPVSDGQMVAKVTFGFWVSFFYGENFQGGSRIWSGNSLGRVFPNAPMAALRPKALRKLLESIRRLRNRTMHHEPLWNQPALLMTHSEVIRTIEWMNADVGVLAKAMDRFPEVHAAGVATFLPILDMVFPEMV